LGRVFERIQRDRKVDLEQGDLLLLRRDGLVVSAPEARRARLLHRNLADGGSQASILAGAGKSGFLVERLGDEDSLVGYAHSEGASGWSALVVQESGIAFAPVHRLRSIVLGVGAAVALVAIGASLFLARRTTGPLLDLAAAAGRVAEGDLDVQVKPQSPDEIGALASTFDHMVQDLRRQRAQLVDKAYVDSLISSMGDGLFVVDARGIVQKVNRALLELAASSEEDLIGRPAAALFVEGEPAFRALVLEPSQHEAVREVELRILRGHNQAPVPVLLSAGVLPADDRDLRDVVCIATDITHRKSMEEQLVEAREGALAAARAKAEFLATVSHEVRTPLNGVLGMMDLLAGTSLADQQRTYVETARLSSEALLAILNDILDYSKGDAAKLELERVEFDLRACLEAAADIVGLRALEKGLELAIYVDEGVARRVVGDPARLSQVLFNLGSNAVKFTPRGGVTLRAEPDPATSARVRFTVSDTGIGIPADRLDRLFKPFSQVDASTTRRYGGTGLGLAIAKQIVGLLGGEIGVETEEGKGSVFWFTAELPPVAEPKAAAVGSAEDLEGLRVLVVDDNAINRQVLREMLRSWQSRPEEATDAWEALEMLRSAAGTVKEFDLALIDFQMPEMDGGQLAEEIKRDARISHIPLLLLTSMPQHGDAARLMRLGFAAYLTKPIRQAVLRNAILGVIRPKAKPGAHLSLVAPPAKRETPASDTSDRDKGRGAR
ncbi:MAG TPA: ATP-binding protein, partial [Vicinamibacteria bacterium]